MLLKIQRGTFDPRANDIAPTGEELWSGQVEELSAAMLTTMSPKLELGTWYRLDEFAQAIEEIEPDKNSEVPSAITVNLPGVAKQWSTAIQVGQASAVLMICRSVIDHVKRMRVSGEIWVRFE